MAVYIFVDDERVPSDVTWKKMPKATKWDVCRSYTGFTKFLESLDKAPYYISLDDILKDERTGLHCARALTMICQRKGWKLPSCSYHGLDVEVMKAVDAEFKFAEKFLKEYLSGGVPPSGNSERKNGGRN